jgi:membrane dipeptidase
MNYQKISFVFVCWALVSACSPADEPPAHQRIARQYLIIDTHIDVPYRIFRQPTDVSVATETGQFDYPRAKAGGLNAPFMSIYIPAATDEAGDAFDFAEQAIASVESLAAAHPDKFAIATCTSDIYQQFDQGLISLPMGMENGGPIDSNISNLEHFYKKGIRYITLAHSKSNHISDSSYDTNEHWQGLSEFGKTLIGEMNRVGVMVDVSHISDKAFWQVMELSDTPVIASHSSLRHFTPEFQRNMNDEMLAAMAERGGVIQINFGSSFLDQVAQDFGIARTAAVREHQLANHLADDDPTLMTFAKAYVETHPYPFADLDSVLDHIDHAVQIAGINAVGIGSDYDGVGDSLPVGLKDVSAYPNLIEGLLKRGYTEVDIVKILGGNLMRVWQAVEQFATSQGTPTQCANG